MKKVQNLSPSQEALRKFILSEINNGNRVIAFTTDGHFGAESSIKAINNKIKVLSFGEIINKKVMPILKKVISIFASLVTGAVTVAGKANVQAATNNVINNIVPEKEKSDNSFKYFLGYYRFNKKFKKVKKIIYIKNFDLLNNEEIIKFKILKNLIDNKKIPHVVLIVSKNKDTSTLLNRILNKPTFEHYSLTREDIVWFFQQKGYTNLVVKNEDVSLIKVLGLDFLLNYYEDILEFTSLDNVSNAIEKTRFIIDKIIEDANIDSTSKNRMFSLLNFASVFYKYFTRLEIANYKENAFEIQNIDKARELSILRNQDQDRFIFNYDIFREFYYETYKSTLIPTPKNLFSYIISSLSFEYITLLRVIDIDLDVCDFKTKLSILVKAYYFAYVYGNAEDRRYILESKYCKSLLVINLGLSTFEDFIQGKPITDENLEPFYEYVLNDNLDFVAKSMALALLLQIAKECIKNWEKYDEALSQFKNSIINISLKSKENIYWQVCFKELFIAFSLEAKKIDTKTIGLFKKEIQEKQCDNEINEFILSHRPIKHFTRLLLLSASIDDQKTAENNLLNLLKISRDIVTTQLAYINLSSLYLETLQLKKSFLCNKKLDENLLLQINNDTYLSYKNNNLTAKFLLNKITQRNYLEQLNKLINKFPNYADLDIIKNNYYAAKLDNLKDYTDIINSLEGIITNSNPYSAFYAKNNLLYIYFKIDEIENFNKLLKDTLENFPVLFSLEESFFKYKYEFILNNWNRKNLIRVPIPTKFNKDIFKMYAQLVMFSGIERWFE